MLFQHLYNWIKYKTLPPSVLFKNRLFIERDSKFRRITNNLGLTFRNSKWTNFEMNNLHYKFFTSYFVIILFAITIFFIIFTYFNFPYYSTSTIFNQVAFILWSGVDLIDYYINFFIWSFIIISTTFLKGIYSYFYTPFVNDEKKILQLIYLQRFKNEKLFSIFDEKKITKKDYKWVLFTWLNSSTSKNKDIQLESLFEQNTFKPLINDLTLFFYHLFKMTYLIDKLISTSNKYSSIDTLNNLLFQDKILAPSFFVNPSLYFYIKSCKFIYFQNYLLNFYLNYNKKNFCWNLNIPSSSNNFKYNLESIYYLTFLTPTNLLSNTYFKEYFLVNLNLIKKLNLSRTYRWFYKYSVIHRKNFKNSHKITLTKKLLNTGILNKGLVYKNLWNSEFHKKFNQINLSHSFNNLFAINPLFPDMNFSNTADFNKIMDSKNLNLANLGFYEYSYFWLINRFKFFNNLQNNSMMSSLQPHQKTSTNITYFNAPSSTINWFSTNPFNETFYLYFFNTKIVNSDKIYNKLIKDIVLSNEFSSLFETYSLSNSIELLENFSILNSRFHYALFFSTLLQTNQKFSHCILDITSRPQHQDLLWSASFNHFTDLYSFLNL